MPTATAPPPETVLTGKELAERWKLEEQTLHAARCLGRPHPKFFRIGRTVRYRLRDVEEFERKNTVSRGDQND